MKYTIPTSGVATAMPAYQRALTEKHINKIILNYESLLPNNKYTIEAQEHSNNKIFFYCIETKQTLASFLITLAQDKKTRRSSNELSSYKKKADKDGQIFIGTDYGHVAGVSIAGPLVEKGAHIVPPAGAVFQQASSSNRWGSYAAIEKVIRNLPGSSPVLQLFNFASSQHTAPKSGTHYYTTQAGIKLNAKWENKTLYSSATIARFDPQVPHEASEYIDGLLTLCTESPKTVRSRNLRTSLGNLVKRIDLDSATKDLVSNIIIQADQISKDGGDKSPFGKYLSEIIRTTFNSIEENIVLDERREIILRIKNIFIENPPLIARRDKFINHTLTFIGTGNKKCCHWSPKHLSSINLIIDIINSELFKNLFDHDKLNTLSKELKEAKILCNSNNKNPLIRNLTQSFNEASNSEGSNLRKRHINEINHNKENQPNPKEPANKVQKITDSKGLRGRS